jgi:hypothetical protein
MVQPLLNKAAEPTIRKADLLPGWLQCSAGRSAFLHLTMEQWAIAQPTVDAQQHARDAAPCLSTP